MNNFKKHKRLVIKGVLLLVLVWGIVAGLIFLGAQKDIKIHRQEVKKCYENLKNEVTRLEEQEKAVKEQFAKASQLSEKGEIKRKLVSLQDKLFDQKKELSYHPFLEKGSKKQDKKAWASQIKEKLKKQLTELENGTHKDPEYDGLQGNPIFQFYFARFELEEKDCQEIRKIIGEINQIQKAIREKEKQEQEEKLTNNTNLFYCSFAHLTNGNCSIEWKGMQSYVSFGKVENGKHFSLMVPVDHPALDNVLFNNGWGTNSEIGPWFEIEGTENIPLEESPHPGTAEQFRWHKFIDYKDKININHVQ